MSLSIIREEMSMFGQLPTQQSIPMKWGKTNMTSAGPNVHYEMSALGSTHLYRTKRRNVPMFFEKYMMCCCNITKEGRVHWPWTVKTSKITKE